MTRIMPRTSFLIKEGLYIHEYEKIIGSMTTTIWELYSVDGWCFYDLEQPENYNEEGELLPPENRIYAQYMIMSKDEQYVADNIISVPLQDGYENVSTTD